ncbi:MAG TPA: LemA family protein [Pseudonocardiaceae bacterium]|nr:LemA family protein [Pseudonocardiaceae bacterium]
METVLVVVLGALLLVAIGLIVSYNRFVSQRNMIDESWRQVDVELQRRHDLIPNLVESVKASARFEQSTLRQVVQARAEAIAAREAPEVGHAQQGAAEQQLSGALRGFFAVAESYPELRSSQNFLALQEQLAETEDRIAAGRRFYNGNVRAFNTRIGQFPSSAIAGMFKFRPAEYFEVDEPDVRATPSLAGAFEDMETPPMGQPLAPPPPQQQVQPPHAPQPPA